MVHRVGLFVASLAAAFAIAVGLALAGIGPGSTSSAAAPAVTNAAPWQGPVQVDTVYVTQPVASPAAAARDRGDDHHDGDREDDDDRQHDDHDDRRHDDHDDGPGDD